MQERLNELVQNEVFMKRLLALDTDVEVRHCWQKTMWN